MVDRERGPRTIRVMIATESRDLLDKIQMHLADAFPIQVVGTASSGKECLKRVQDFRPDVVVIVEGLSDLPALQVSKQVNAAHRNVATVLVTEQYTTDYFDRALAAGARRVIPIDVSRERLVTGISEAYELIKGAVGPEVSAVPVGERLTFTVYSAKGGVGKSLLASNLAAIWARTHPAKKVILVDLNLQFNTLGALLNIHPLKSIYDLLPVIDDLSAAAISNVLCRKSIGDGQELLMLSAPLEPRQADGITGVHINNVLIALKRYYDITVVDTTSTISDVTLAALQMADTILQICTPDVLAIGQTRSSLEFMSSLGVGRDKIRLVLNRISKRAEIQPDDIKRLFDVSVIGEIPSDFLSIQPYLNSGTLLAEVPKRLPIVEGMRQIAHRLIPPAPGERPAPKRSTRRR